MGVFSKIERAKQEIRRRGDYFYYTEWRITGAGARDFIILLKKDTLEPLDYEYIPSTYGTHPHIVFDVPKDVSEVIRVRYHRTSSGFRNEIVIEECEVRPKEAGEVSLRCRLVISKKLPRDEVLSSEEEVLEKAYEVMGK